MLDNITPLQLAVLLTAVSAVLTAVAVVLHQLTLRCRMKWEQKQIEVLTRDHIAAKKDLGPLCDLIIRTSPHGKPADSPALDPQTRPANPIEGTRAALAAGTPTRG